jgi:glycosyltransferase involved in cell wall biosynthesis
VIKEAMALSRGGYEVEILGAWFEPELKARDQQLMAGLPFRFLPVIDAVHPVGLERFRHTAHRARAKAGNLFCRHTGIANSWQFGRMPSALLDAARRAQGDLYLVHLESAMVAGRELLADGRRVGIDMEDWYSEDLLPEARRYRPTKLLRALEQQLLRHGVHSTCPSGAMSGALAQEFDCRPPQVIYNAFPWADRKGLDARTMDRQDMNSRSIYWFSQTIGPGRGLEDLFAALPFLTEKIEVHLRGKAIGGLENWLDATVPASHRPRIHCHGLVSNQELLSRIAEHDIGFAGELKYCRSKDLTASNKLFQYLLAGVPVVASDTAGQREVAEEASGAVHIYEAGRSASLAVQLNRLLESPSLLAHCKTTALRWAESKFCWERQEQAFLNSIEIALSSRARATIPTRGFRV